jgi:TonB family protein
MPESKAAAIFEQSTLGRNWPRRPTLAASIALHLVLFLLVLRGRTPVFVAPASVLGGARGTTVTHLYWTTGSSTDGPSSENGSHERKHAAARSPLTWKGSHGRELASNQRVSADSSSGDTRSASAPAPSAGSPYGSLSDEATAGEEIRPALPAVTSEPHVNLDDLRGIAEGNVVIEITIDESGAIVNKTVVQSMGPAIDAQVLAALENWRFRPATRDGVPMPSKQDVVYHFKPRPS